MIWDRVSPQLLRNVSQYFRKLTTSCRFCALKADAVAVKDKTAEATSVVKDVIIYKFESPRFYKYLNVFALTQYGFWMYISSSSMKMIDVPVRETNKNQEEEDLPFWRKINLGADKYKYGLTAGAGLMGFGILFVSWTYILRSVRYLILRKDGLTVAFVTYAPFGRNRIMDVPIKNISAAGSRTSGASQMPVKVRGRYLYYLIDLKEGKFPHPQVFDRTVGTKRKLN